MENVISIFKMMILWKREKRNKKKDSLEHFSQKLNGVKRMSNNSYILV